MRLIYDDVTAKWVPFATAGIIVAMVWGGIVWEQVSISAATVPALVVAVLLLIGIFAQGWLYWNGQVETLSFDGATAEAKTMRWVGWGRKVRFAPGEASGWRTIAKHSDATVLSSIEFTAKGAALSMSFLSPRLVDLEALRRLAPEFFVKVLADYPALAAVAGGSH